MRPYAYLARCGTPSVAQLVYICDNSAFLPLEVHAMSLRLVAHTLTTYGGALDDVALILYWRDYGPIAASARVAARAIDATVIPLEQVYKRCLSSGGSVALVGIDILLATRRHSAAQLLALIKALARETDVTVVVAADDAVRQDNEHEYFLQQLLHAATEEMLAVRAIPSGRDRVYAGMMRTSRPASCMKVEGDGERLSAHAAR